MTDPGSPREPDDQRAGSGSDDEHTWDLVAAQESPQPVPAPRVEPYNPDRDREAVRSRIAIGLLLLIGALSLGTIGLYLAGRSLDDIAKLYGLVVSPLIALTSGIVGFYFGAESRRRE
jgi:uncharacterized membrane protein YuzA (DUF378 family)